MKAEILTNSGAGFNLANLQSNTVSIYDIAKSLSKVCKFNGNCDTHYSVAQHSVLASRHISNQALAFESLLRQVAVFATGDLSQELKQVLPEAAVFQRRVELAIMRHFDLPIIHSDEVEEMEAIMDATEKRDLFSNSQTTSATSVGLTMLREIIKPWSPKRAEHEFLVRFTELTELASHYHNMIQLDVPKLRIVGGVSL